MSVTGIGQHPLYAVHLHHISDFSDLGVPNTSDYLVRIGSLVLYYEDDTYGGTHRLPAGYRPDKEYQFPLNDNTYVTLHPNGDVDLIAYDGGTITSSSSFIVCYFTDDPLI